LPSGGAAVIDTGTTPIGGDLCPDSQFPAAELVTPLAFTDSVCSFSINRVSSWHPVCIAPCDTTIKIPMTFGGAIFDLQASWGIGKAEATPPGSLGPLSSRTPILSSVPKDLTCKTNFDLAEGTNYPASRSAAVLVSVIVYVASYVTGLGNISRQQGEFSLEVRGIRSFLCTTTTN